MKKIKYIISIFALALLASCTQEIQAPVISVRTVTIDQGDQALTVGQSVKLTASVQPGNATDRDVKWSSSNEDIAMVSAGGNVKALSVGEVAITAEAGGVSDLITVKVVAKLVPVNGVSINPSSTTLKLGETQLLKAEITPSDATNKSVKWASSNGRVASVEKGVITGLKPGTATITVTTNDGDKTAECSVTVEDEPLPVVTLDAENIVFNAATLCGKLLNTPTSNTKVGFQYSLSLETILFGSQTVEAVSVDAAGKFSAEISDLKPQTMYYYRTVLKQDGKDYCGEVKSFTTPYIPVQSVSLDIVERTIHTIGETVQLTATVLPEDAHDKGLSWSTDDEDVAKVSETGFVTTVGNGTAIITVTTNDQSKTASCTVTVSQYVTGITLDKSSIDMLTGETATVCVSEITPTNAVDQTYTWSSSDTDVVTIDTDGVITAVAAGETTVIATANDGSEVFATCTVKVTLAFNPVPGEAVDLGLSVKWSSLNLGATKPEEYGGYLAWGEIETKSDYYWNTYKWCNGSFNTLTKYNDNSYGGTVDNIANLESEDDAAIVYLGGNWRMPTKEECLELKTQCTWTWTTLNGVYGYNVQGPSGNSIFLPVPGYKVETHLDFEKAEGYYWSSTVSTGYPGNAWCLFFYSNNELLSVSPVDRYSGRSIRPVYAPFNVEAVDLGLPSGLKWANANLGADAVEESGDFYAWGETEPYYSSLDPLTWKDGKSAGYNNSSYKFYSGGTYTKYHNSVDSKTILDPEDDAAHVVLGGTWRMPTTDEWTELVNNCEWTWVSSGGKLGYTVTGTNSNSIFIPASGLMSNKSLDNVGFGNYWTADLDDSFNEYAHYYAVSNEYLKYSMPFYYTNSYYRYYGYTIRAVTE